MTKMNVTGAAPNSSGDLPTIRLRALILRWRGYRGIVYPTVRWDEVDQKWLCHWLGRRQRIWDAWHNEWMLTPQGLETLRRKCRQFGVMIFEVPPR